MNTKIAGITNIFRKHPSIIAGLFLAVLIVAVYHPVKDYDFICFDDDLYVYENHQVKRGLTADGLKWAFGLSNTKKTYWHPLTWISYMLDYELFGLDPGGFHLTNLAFHILNSLLLFVLFRQMTGTLWRSFFVAVVFSLHPLNVDSVAWVAERKNLLSTLFWILTLMAYVRYSRKPGLTGYLLILAAFIPGLLSKPMLVTLPCVMLLLDYWPLGRIKTLPTLFTYSEATGKSVRPVKKASVLWLVLEKAPLLALSLLVTFLASKSLQNSSIFISTEIVPMDLRIANALISYVLYIWKMIFPQNLAILYPFPQVMPPGWQTGGALLILLGVSLICLRYTKRMPYLLTGWLWYLGTLVPVSGLVQAGLWPALADRWAYVPLIGLFIIIAWAIPAIIPTERPRRKFWMAGSAVIILAIMMVTTQRQIHHWKNSITLFTHTLAVTSDNFISHNNLGSALAEKDQVEAALGHYREALRINPDYADAHNNLGTLSAEKGLIERAVEHYREALRLKPDHAAAHNNLGVFFADKGQPGVATQRYLAALRINPDYADAHYNLGNTLAEKGQFEVAIEHYLEALRINPDYADAYINLGNALGKKGQTDDAIENYQAALQIKPDSAKAHYNLGNAFAKKGQSSAAIDHYRKALRIKPDYVEAHYNLGNLLAEKGQSEAAVEHYLAAIRTNPDYADAHYNLGNLFAEKGQIEAAIEHYREALRIKPDYANAHYNLGNALARKRLIDGAIKHYLETLRLEPDRERAHNNLGVAFSIKGDIAKAVEHFKKALQINPHYLEARNNLNSIQRNQ